MPVPDLQMLARTQVSAHVQQLLASGDKTGAIKAYRAETNVDLAKNPWMSVMPNQLCG